MISVPVAFAISGALIFVGFLANQFYHKIRIPDSVFLILLGILLGPLAHVFDPQAFKAFSPFMASVAIMVILFEAGLNLNPEKVLKEAPKAFVLSIITFFGTMSLISAAGIVFFKLEITKAFILGALLGGTSAAVVIPLADVLGLAEEDRSLLGLESTFTNIYNVILVLVFVKFLETAVDPSTALNMILSSFSVSVFLGGIVGYAWAKAWRQIKHMPYSYMLTLAMLLWLFSFSEYVKANGPLSALVFGLVLSSSRSFKDGSKNVLYLHREISFFVKVFFFFFLGLIFSPTTDPRIWLFGLLIGLFSALVRFFAATAMRLKRWRLFSILVPRGLSEAVVVSLLLQYGLPEAELFLQITSVTILLTNLLTAFALLFEKAETTGH